MRTLVLILLVLVGFSQTGICGSRRLGKIIPGMTRTDVAIELGRPADVRVDQDAVLWVYPSSASEVCTIRFVRQKVTQEVMKCDSSASSKEFALKSAPLLSGMNSEKEYLGRVERYCGRKPKPTPGCQISPQCTNGGWEEVCK